MFCASARTLNHDIITVYRHYIANSQNLRYNCPIAGSRATVCVSARTLNHNIITVYSYYIIVSSK